MIQKTLLLALGATSFALTISSCVKHVDVPGDTNVETRTVERDTNPGNILAEGRIRAAGIQ